MQISATTVESNTEIPQKAKDRNAILSSDTAPEHLPNGT
jgi:hypothetical protein